MRLPLRLFFNDHYHVPLPAGHRFPMPKYGMVRQSLQRELEPRGLATFHPSPLATLDELTCCHTHDYVDKYVNNKLSREENRRVGFPWSQASVDRSLSSTGGTIAAMREVCTTSAVMSGHLAGGTHHAFADRGEGYCVFNDIGVAALVALRDYPELIRRILIVDLDVHQGNGCAVIFQGEPRVTTFSLHCSGNYFSAKQSSDVDVEVPVGSGDEAYLQLLREHLPPLFASVRQHARHRNSRPAEPRAAPAPAALTRVRPGAAGAARPHLLPGGRRPARGGRHRQAAPQLRRAQAAQQARVRPGRRARHARRRDHGRRLPQEPRAAAARRLGALAAVFVCRAVPYGRVQGSGGCERAAPGCIVSSYEPDLPFFDPKFLLRKRPARRMCTQAREARPKDKGEGKTPCWRRSGAHTRQHTYNHLRPLAARCRRTQHPSVGATLLTAARPLARALTL